MAPSNTLSTFSRFSRFPPELRLQIWRESLPDLGIALHNYKRGCWGPQKLPKVESEAEPDEQHGTDQDVVNFGFCHEMLDTFHVDMPLVFVNHEARSVALAWAHEQGIDMRFSEDTKRHVFVRRFDPMRDALFIGINQWDDFCLEPFDRLAQPDLFDQTVTNNPELTRIAVPHTTIWADCATLPDVFHWFPRLQVLFVILDIQLDLNMERMLLKGDRKKARARLQNQQWKVGDARGRALVWNAAKRRFDWRGSVGLGNQALFRQMEEAAREMHAWLAQREAGSFEIQPVYAVRGW